MLQGLPQREKGFSREDYAAQQLLGTTADAVGFICCRLFVFYH
jgi:hypothetical protein